MSKLRALLSVGFLCFVAAAASADSVNTIPITGTTYYGFAITEGDYTIQGPGLNLFQGDPDGPSAIGDCNVGAVCSFTWSPAGPGSFCGLCTVFSGGSFGSTAVQWLSPNLVFTGSAFYAGGDTLSMNFNLSGTIYGYQLVGCDSNGFACSLGPQVFALNISGTGAEMLSMNGFIGSPAEIFGLQGTFSGTATPITTTPEPASFLLMGTGLAGLWMKRRRAG
jgi:hypothetical protein